MTAAEALESALAAGIRIALDGNDLVLEAARTPPAQVVDALLCHKSQLVALLRSSADGWSVQDWHAFFSKRAALTEFDGGLPRSKSEDRAFACCVVEWLNRYPVISRPGRCLACGERDYRNDPLLPYGTESPGHAWLHSGCWEDWHSGRKSDAVTALKAMGIGCGVSEAKSEERFERPARARADGANAFGIQNSGFSSLFLGLPRKDGWGAVGGAMDVSPNANMSAQTSKPFAGLCHCGVPGLYVMNEGLEAGGRLIWFCYEHKPDFRKLQYEHAMRKRGNDEGRGSNE